MKGGRTRRRRIMKMMMKMKKTMKIKTVMTIKMKEMLKMKKKTGKEEEDEQRVYVFPL